MTLHNIEDFPKYSPRWAQGLRRGYDASGRKYLVSRTVVQTRRAGGVRVIGFTARPDGWDTEAPAAPIVIFAKQLSWLSEKLAVFGERGE